MSIAKSCREISKRAKQQELSAWQPIYTFHTLFYPLLLVGSLFIPVGAVLLYMAYSINEAEIEYSGEKCIVGSFFNFSSGSCDDFLKENPGEQCSCDVFFTLPYQFQGKVFIYYKLTNFYQNHRKYVNSLDPNQLAGRIGNNSYTCWPYITDPETRLSYAPCGAIANSLFNDSFKLTYVSDVGGKISVPLSRTQIAWRTDKQKKYKNPPSWEGTIKPPNWKYPAIMLDTESKSNTGYENEALMVWMRTAAFPNFRKPYARIDHDAVSKFKEGLPGGSYILHISYNYPTFRFGGTKSIVLMTLSWMGSKSVFIGYAYMFVGFLCIGLICTFRFVYVHWNEKITLFLETLNRDSPYFIR